MARRSKAIKSSSETYKIRDPGGRALLFERLSDNQFHTQSETKPFRYHDLEGLERSIYAELDRLLNTRRGPLSSHVETRDTVLSYGLPDNVLDDPNSVRNQEKICLALKSAIQAFEPRLEALDISVVPGETNSQAITVEIGGQVELGSVKLAVRFPIVVGGEPDFGND